MRFSHVSSQGTKGGATILIPRANGKANNGNTSVLPRQRNPKPVHKCTGKVTMTFFFDCMGPLLVDFLERGATINAKCNADTLQKLRRAMKSERPGMLSDGIILLHDNARPHTANLARDKLQRFGWETLQHPPYSPDLSPCDFHIFRKPEEKHSWTSLSFGRGSARADEVVDPLATYLFL